MLPKSKRLSRDDFSKFQKKTIIHGVFFDLSISKSTENTRFAVVISKKRIKLAVDRNTIRRRIYSSLKDITLKSPYLVIIYPKQNINNAPYKAINDEIQSIFAKL